MIAHAPLRIVLCGLTGLGNSVLEALSRDPRVDVRAVFTVSYRHPSPYYEERQLADLCEALAVPCHADIRMSGDEGLALVRAAAPDLIVLATFKEILKGGVFSVPRLGIVNFHPSLLPAYRGPCPTHAVLLNDERETGITVHYVAATVDAGDVLLRRSLTIVDTDNDGRLRQKLAALAGEMVPGLVGLFAGSARPPGVPQDSSLAPTGAPRPVPEDGYLERTPDVDGIRRRVRAYNPFPGTSILVEGRRIAVDRFEAVRDGRAPGLYECETAVDVVRPDGAVRLFKRTGPPPWFAEGGTPETTGAVT